MYGHVWCPRGVNAGWRPYHDGHWVWVDPYGWTWVGSESWGWAPYHYGTWVHASYGWGWAPGPVQQYWSPAVVSFSTYNGAVAWCPLAPSEVVYPAAISFGFSSGNWAFSFAIGGAACYYPGGGNYCVGRPWSNGYVNRAHYGFNAAVIGSAYGGRGWVGANRFQPMYGRQAFAITRTTTAGFVGGSRFQTGSASDIAIFRRGQSFSAPAGHAPMFGPANVRPTRVALTTSRSFSNSRPSSSITDRAVFRAPVSGGAARFSPKISRVMSTSNRAAQVVRGPVNRTARSAVSGQSKYARPNPRRAECSYCSSLHSPRSQQVCTSESTRDDNRS